ncbi:MAG: hypothetical protein NVSMB17_00090 [Candidatus Dormibacteria bacterium]
MRRRKPWSQTPSPEAGMAALEWILLMGALAGFVAILVIFYASSQPTHLAPMR